MNCFKNPRLKNQGKAEKLGRLFELNIIHMGTMLRTCYELYPGDFYPKKCATFVEEYIETAREYGCDDETELRDRKIAELVEDTPYISWKAVHGVIDSFAERASGTDKLLYSEPYFYEMLSENLLLMFMQLHYSNKIGLYRFGVICEMMKRKRMSDELVFGWLGKITGEPLKNDPAVTYEYLEELARYRHRKNRSTATLREQLDARRHMEALRAYQSEVRTHDKLAGGAPKQGT